MKNAVLPLLLEQCFIDSDKKGISSYIFWGNLGLPMVVRVVKTLSTHIHMEPNALLACDFWVVELEDMTLRHLSHQRGIYSENDKELIHKDISWPSTLAVRKKNKENLQEKMCIFQ